MNNLENDMEDHPPISPEDAMNANMLRWDELARAHAKPGSAYDMEAFRAGRSILNWLEKELLGDEIRGKKILHLQCHFGLDTISLYREGAKEVVGVDFSKEAVAIGNQLIDEFDLSEKVRFVQANIMNITETFQEFEQFDLVYTSYGTIVWLPDLMLWAKAIAAYLKPGGKFVIIDSHPMSHVFDDESEEHRLSAVYPYFDAEKPEYYRVEGSYATSREIRHKDEYIWTHSLSTIFNSIIQHGLQIRSFEEYPMINWKMYPFLNKTEKENPVYQGWYTFPKDWKEAIIPLCFALIAQKPINTVA